MTNPLLLTFDELERGFFFRDDVRYNFGGGGVAPSSLPVRLYNRHPSYKIVREGTDALYSPKRGMFDIIAGDLPERCLTLDLLTPYFRSRIDSNGYLSEAQRELVDAIVRFYGASDFTVSELAERRIPQRETRPGVSPQSMIAQTFSELVKVGIVQQGQRTVDGILCTIKSPLFVKWYQSFMGLVSDDEANRMHRDHSTVESVKPFVIIPSKTITLPPLKLVKEVQTSRRPGWVPRHLRTKTCES